MTELIVRLFVKDRENRHDPAVRERYGVVAGVVCMIANILLCSTKFAIGVIAGSVAIQADAVNNLSDVGSSAVVIFGAKAANKPADSEHPYGHARMEYIVSLGIAFVIMIVGVSLGRESIEKIISPEPVDFSVGTLAVLTMSILVKLWMGSFTAKIGRAIDSQTMAAAAKDSLSDVVSTGVILLSCIACMIWDINIDGYMGVLAALFVLYSGVGIIKDTIGPLLGERPDKELVDKLASRILSYDGITGIHDIMVHDYGPGRIIATAHAEVSDKSDILKIHETIDLAERETNASMGVMLTLHLDPVETDNCELDKARSIVGSVISEIPEILSMHDLRMVNGEKNINLIFDIVVSPETQIKECSYLMKQVADLVKKANPIYSCVIRVDFDYS